jgi:hypothetical protein
VIELYCEVTIGYNPGNVTLFLELAAKADLFVFWRF